MIDIFQASLISLLYLIFKVIENKFINKEEIPVKNYMKSIILVFFSVICGNFILEQIKPLTGNILNNPSVFTSDPNF